MEQRHRFRAGPTSHIIDLVPHMDRLDQPVVGVIQEKSGEVVHIYYDPALSLEEVMEKYVDEAAGDQIVYSHGLNEICPIDNGKIWPDHH